MSVVLTEQESALLKQASQYGRVFLRSEVAKCIGAPVVGRALVNQVLHCQWHAVQGAQGCTAWRFKCAARAASRELLGVQGYGKALSAAPCSHRCNSAGRSLPAFTSPPRIADAAWHSRQLRQVALCGCSAGPNWILRSHCSEPRFTTTRKEITSEETYRRFISSPPGGWSLGSSMESRCWISLKVSRVCDPTPNAGNHRAATASAAPLLGGRCNWLSGVNSACAGLRSVWHSELPLRFGAAVAASCYCWQWDRCILASASNPRKLSRAEGELQLAGCGSDSRIAKYDLVAVFIHPGSCQQQQIGHQPY